MVLPKKEATLFVWLCICVVFLGSWVDLATGRRKNNKNVSVDDISANQDPKFICPAICLCIPGQERTKSVILPSTTTALELIGMKLVCQNQAITSLKTISSLADNPYVTFLDISNNQITNLKAEDINFPQLKFFILRNNSITTIDSGAFNRLPKLKFLDLSENSLEIISTAMFRGLPTLERLNLTGNPIKRVKNGTFDGLISLKRLGLSSTLLPCECNLSPLLKWQHLRSLRIIGACQLGDVFKPIRDLTIEDLCSPDNLIFEILPATSQIVFEGDAITLKCKINPAQNLTWSTPISSRMLGSLSYLENGTSLSIWQLKAITKADEGLYVCHSPIANRTRTLNVTVITLSTPSCPFEVMASDKGRYAWPLTLPGIQVNLPCQVPTRDTITASRQCTSNGTWEVATLQQCPYLTKLGEILRPVLEDQVGTITEDEISEEVMEAVSEGYYSREWDVIYLIRALRKLKSIQWNVTAYLLSGEEEAFRLAKILDPVMNQLPDKVVETFQNSKLLQQEKENFALKRLDLHSYSSGAMCSWRRKPLYDLDCKSTNHTVNTPNDKSTEALIQMPGLEEQIVMSVFTDKYASLFDIGNYTLSSSIFGIHARYSNFTFPVYIMMQFHSTAMPFHFTFANDNWTMQNCTMDKTQPWEEDGRMVFSCPTLGYFALLSPVVPVAQIYYANPVLWPGVYAGTALAFSCYILCITVYLKCKLRLGRNIRHALVNTWISASFLCFFYAAGIRQTAHLVLCQSVGMILHYFTLSIILWMIISASILAKSLAVKTPLPLTEETIMEEPPLPKSIIRFYLMGWGLGLIVCGISGALHFSQYAHPSYCFLDGEPALATIGVPSGILLLLLMGYYVHIGLLIRKSSHNSKTSVSSLTQVTQLSGDITQVTAASAIPLTETHPMGVQVDLVDEEEESNKDGIYSPQAQLQGLVLSAILTALVWLCSFLAVYQPWSNSFTYAEITFNAMYIISASACGVFTFVFFVMCRGDVHNEYQGALSTSAKSSITESVPNNNVPRTVPSITHSQPSTSNQCSQSLATDINSPCLGRESPKLEVEKRSLGSFNSSISPRMNRSVRSAPVLTSRNFMLNPMDQAQAFYDPRQSGAARRFFKKQKMLKNNFGPADNAEVVQNNFLPMDSSRSKINNVNIHVELGTSEMNKLEEMKRKTSDFASLQFIAEEPGIEEPPVRIKEKRLQSRKNGKLSLNDLNAMSEEDDASVNLSVETSV